MLAPTVPDTVPPDAAATVRRTPTPLVRRLLIAVPDLVAPAVAGFSLPAMLLLLLGFFVVPLVVALGLAGAAAAVAMVLRGDQGDAAGGDEDDARHALIWTVLALAVAGGFFLFNAGYSAQNLYVTRDPGTYTVTGEWLTHSREALIPTGNDVFDTVPGLTPESMGFRLDVHDADKIYPQGNHLLPALLAVGGWFGDSEVLLRVNPLIGALALLALFGLARRLTGGMFALAVTAALGLSMPMLHFSRDNYTEPLTLLLLFGGLSLLWHGVQTRRPAAFLVAGLTMGSTAMARIDAYAGLLAVIVAAVVLLARARPGERRGWLARVGLLVAGTMVTAWLGFVDVTQLSSGYYADTRQYIFPLLLAALALLIGGGFTIALAWRTPVLGYLVSPRRRELVAAAAAVLVVATFAVLASRPLWMTAEGECQPIVGSLQESLGLEVEPCRTYDEQTVSWFTWYYGWPTYVLAVLGLALLARRLIRTGDQRPVALVAAVGVLSVIYFNGARIYPDQIWAMRRFLPVVIPGLLIGAGYLLHLLWRHGTAGRAGRLGGLLAGGLAVLLVVWPAGVTHPMWRVRTGVPQLDQVRAVCDRVGDDAALVSLGTSGIGTYTQTMRSFCEVPTQAMADPTPSLLAQVRENVEASGRTLYVMAEQSRFMPYAPGVPEDPGAFSTVTVTKWPERLEEVPQSAHRYTVAVYLGEVNADGTVRPVR